jgi:large subunit ribosomal protein L15
MPLQMRLPKYGFSSRIGRKTAEVRTSELNQVDADVITVEALRKANLITANITRVKVMLSGDVTKAVTVDGLGVTKGARVAIEAAGGKIIEATPVDEKPGKLAKKPAKAGAKTETKKVAKAEDLAKEKRAEVSSDNSGEIEAE